MYLSSAWNRCPAEHSWFRWAWFCVYPGCSIYTHNVSPSQNSDWSLCTLTSPGREMSLLDLKKIPPPPPPKKKLWIKLTQGSQNTMYCTYDNKLVGIRAWQTHSCDIEMKQSENWAKANGAGGGKEGAALRFRPHFHRPHTDCVTRPEYIPGDSLHCCVSQCSRPTWLYVVSPSPVSHPLSSLKLCLVLKSGP